MDTDRKIPFRFYLVRFTWIMTCLVVISLFIVGSVYSYRLVLAPGNAPKTGQESPSLNEVLVAAGLDPRAAVLLVIGFESISGLISVALGILLFLRLLSPDRPYDRMAMFTSFMLLTYGLLISSVVEVIGEGMEPWNTLYTLVGFFASVLFFLFLLIFPDGRYNPRWTVWIPWTVLAWMIGWFFVPALNPDSWQPIYLNLSVVGLIVLAGSVQVYRYLRLYTPVQKQQTKWVAFVLVVMITAGAVQFLGNGDQPYITKTQGLWFVLFILEHVLLNLLEVIFPATLFLVIMHYKLWEVDRIINKALVYTVVTIVLVVCYFAIVVVLQSVFRRVIGQDSPLAAVVSTLTIAAIFNPARTGIQSFIDRRFYRRHYDAGQALNEFGELVWQETDLETLTLRLREVVQNTLQPDGVGLWLTPVQSPSGSLDSKPY